MLYLRNERNGVSFIYTVSFTRFMRFSQKGCLVDTLKVKKLLDARLKERGNINIHTLQASCILRPFYEQ